MYLLVSIFLKYIKNKNHMKTNSVTYIIFKEINKLFIIIMYCFR